MSLELKINTSFKNSMDFMRDKVVANLNEARGTKFNISDRDFQTLCNLVILSFDQCSPGVFKQADSLVKDIKKTTHTG